MKAKAHTVYKQRNGKRVPGVTTFLDILAKPALYRWNNKMGLQGIDTTVYVDNLAKAGTLAHSMTLAYFKEEEADTSDNTSVQIDLASNSFQSFMSWRMAHTVEPILIETPLVSEEYGFGGTPDLLAHVDGIPTLVDFKTGKGIYAEHLIQVAAYWVLLLEHGYTIEDVKILRIGRDEGEQYEVKQVKALKTNWELFTHCQAIYELQKRVRREEK